MQENELDPAQYPNIVKNIAAYNTLVQQISKVPKKT
jgi:hypothetical protein